MRTENIPGFLREMRETTRVLPEELQQAISSLQEESIRSLPFHDAMRKLITIPVEVQKKDSNLLQ